MSHVIKQPNGLYALFEYLQMERAPHVRFLEMNLPRTDVPGYMVCDAPVAEARIQRADEDDDAAPFAAVDGPHDGLRRWRGALACILARHGQLAHDKARLVGTVRPDGCVVVGYVVRRGHRLGGWCYLGIGYEVEHAIPSDPGCVTDVIFTRRWEDHQRDACRLPRRKAKRIARLLRALYTDARAVPLVRPL